MKRASIRANIVVNLIGPVSRLAIALVTVPIYIRHIGEARYGVVSLAWILLGYFGFLDLGLSRAGTNALAKLHDAPQSERARVLLTTICLNFGFGLIGSVVLFVSGEYVLQHVISVPQDLLPEVVRSFPWIACLLPMTLATGVGIGALESRERFLSANILQFLGASLVQIAPVVVAVAVSPSLTAVIPAAAMGQALELVVVLAVVYRIEGPFSFRAFDLNEARSLLGYGGWVSVSNVISPILVSADQFFIGSIMGAAKVPHYAVPMNLVTRTQLFPAALMRTFFPRMSSLPPEPARQLGMRAVTAASLGYAMVCAPAIILAHPFFRYWINPDFALVAGPVAQILFIGAWINGVNFITFTLLQSQGRPDLTGKIHMAEVLPYLVLLWGLTTTVGIEGAAVAWTLRCVADAVAMSWAARLTRTALTFYVPPLGVLAACVAAAQIIGANVVWALIVATAAALISLALAYGYSEDWRRLVDALISYGRTRCGALGRRYRQTQATTPTRD
jgi:O-antigen/teichoic acid export membrane protein